VRLGLSAACQVVLVVGMMCVSGGYAQTPTSRSSASISMAVRSTEVSPNYSPIEQKLRLELLGKEIVGTQAPAGWKLSGKPTHIPAGQSTMMEYNKKGWRAYAYEEIVEQTGQQSTVRSRVLDVVLIKTKKGQDIPGECRYADGSVLKTQMVVAYFSHRCQRYSDRIDKAWLWNRKTRTVIYSSTKGLICEMSPYGQAADEEPCINWPRCYQHFGIHSDGQILTQEQERYCIDNFPRNPRLARYPKSASGVSHVR